MGSTEAANTPRRPAMTVQVGVTGHRSLPGADAKALHDAAAGVFRAVAAEAGRLLAADQASPRPLFQAGPPTLRCISGLAAGSDSILAEAALQEGWQVVATLPFSQVEFERDFEGDALTRFRGLVKRASVVTELEGDRRRGGEPYAQIGQQVVEQSDIVVAIWDGLPSRGAGGTGDVVQSALARNLPVAVLPPTGPVVVTWQDADDIATILQSILLPHPESDGFPQAYFEQVQPSSTWAATAVRWYEKAILLGTAAPVSNTPSSGTQNGPLVAASEALLLPPFEMADRLAGAFAARYRAAGLMRYGMVLPATLGAFIGYFGSAWAQPFGFLLQFASLVGVLVFSTKGSWVHDHRRFVAYRALAEYIRNARLLMPLGTLATVPGAPLHRERAEDWTAWYGRALLREIGLLPGHYDAQAAADASRFVRASADDEIAFLVGRARRFRTMAARLKLIGVVLSLIGVGFVALHAIFVYRNIAGPSSEWFNELGLVVPAMAPVFLGLLGFGEYERLATRYAAVAAGLSNEVAALDRAGPDRRSILPIARRIADIMLAEGADWQLLIKSKTLGAF